MCVCVYGRGLWPSICVNSSVKPKRVSYGSRRKKKKQRDRESYRRRKLSRERVRERREAEQPFFLRMLGKEREGLSEISSLFVSK